MKCWIIYFVSVALLHQSSGLCQQDSQGNHLFGPTCEFYCHCQNGDQCDSVTGECYAGCEFPWVGRGCQHRDIARNGKTKLLMAYYGKYAGRANDNNTSTCSESKHPSFLNSTYSIYSPFWKVYITSEETIQGLIITTKQANIGDMIGGFNITVENITSAKFDDRTYFPKETRLCYRHQPGKSLNMTFKVQCIHHVVGNQIRFQLANKNAHLALCDVSVLGECPVNQCGPDCLTVCHCKEFNYQDKITGNCSSGCAGRWTGAGKYCDKGLKTDGCLKQIASKVECSLRSLTFSLRLENICWDKETISYECGNQNWGSGCEYKCGYCTDDEPCGVRNGECPNGCVSGYSGKRCIRQCLDGYYGDHCSNFCSGNCIGGNTNCNSTSGHCEQGCIGGWHGRWCTENLAQKVAETVPWITANSITLVILILVIVGVIAGAFIYRKRFLNMIQEVTDKLNETTYDGLRADLRTTQDATYSSVSLCDADANPETSNYANATTVETSQM